MNVLPILLSNPNTFYSLLVKLWIGLTIYIGRDKIRQSYIFPSIFHYKILLLGSLFA